MRLFRLARRHRFALAAAFGALWAVGVLWIVPAIIRSAYRGDSLPILNELISGQGKSSVDVYLEIWTRLAVQATLALVGVALAGLLVGWIRRRLPTWRAREGTEPRAPATMELIALAAWIGILAGLGDALEATVKHRIQHLPIGQVVSGEQFWMAPLTAATFLGVVVLLVSAAHRGLRRQRGRAAVVLSVVGALAAYSLVRAIGLGIMWYASIILAMGLGVALGRVVGRYPQTAMALVRRTTVPIAVALLAWAVVVPLTRRFGEWRAVRALPAARPGAPNVIVLIWDAARAQSLSLYGSERETTPFLERLATRALVFDRAFATAPWSLPSHASIFTARYPNELTTGRRVPLDRTHPTIAEALSRQGYVTGAFTANLFYGSAEYGLARGFSWYDARPPIRVASVLHTWWLTRTLQTKVTNALGNHDFPLRRRASHVSGSFHAWRRRHPDRPFFAVLNHFETHEPYLPPTPFNLAFSQTQPRYWFVDYADRYPSDVLKELETAYETSIRYLDHELERLTDVLRAEGLLENTLIIVTADHGEEFGEHGDDVFGHGRSMFAPALRVPMIVAYAGRIPEPVRIATPVSIRDIPATIMDLVSPSERHTFPGVSLFAYAGGRAGDAALVEPRLAMAERQTGPVVRGDWPLSQGDVYALFRDSLHYIVGEATAQLFDVARDPWERHDLADTPEGRAAISEMHHIVDSLVRTPSGRWSPRWRSTDHPTPPEP